MHLRSTGRLTKHLVLLVGVCLIGTSFHVHQFLPDYKLHSYSLDHHLTINQPDCIACLHLIHGISLPDNSPTQAYFTFDRFIYSPSQRHTFEPANALNNKSPPFHKHTTHLIIDL